MYKKNNKQQKCMLRTKLKLTMVLVINNTNIHELISNCINKCCNMHWLTIHKRTNFVFLLQIVSCCKVYFSLPKIIHLSVFFLKICETVSDKVLKSYHFLFTFLVKFGTIRDFVHFGNSFKRVAKISRN